METTAQAEPDGTDRQVALLLAETMNSLVKGGPLRLPEGVEFTGAVQDRFLGIVLGAVRGLSHEHEDALRRELHDKGVYAPPCQDLAPAGDPGAGHPVVEEGFHSLHPEVGGWNMERWQLAVPGDGDDELGQFAASALQQHLLGAPDFGVGLERLRASTVTLHFFQQTGFDEDLGEESFQGVLYASAVGWVGIDCPEPEDDQDECPEAQVWTSPSLAGLVAAVGDRLAGLRPGTGGAVDDEFGCRWVSHYLRGALEVWPGLGQELGRR
ncbi:hypothetical protein [Kitasatospora sp. NBC_01300]|uniref:hypothetical protein n=1 Tax=Kitasatospora sp. NBC_01300 TaxID=2903574 RepID=UPI002F918096|nr:hypothetical protein OG556_40535 [Kitasatospora sp. NBC_01300]